LRRRKFGKELVNKRTPEKRAPIWGCRVTRGLKGEGKGRGSWLENQELESDITIIGEKKRGKEFESNLEHRRGNSKSCKKRKKRPVRKVEVRR